MFKLFKKPKGFVILFASVIAAIIMVISFAMYTVSIKSIALANISHEALSALYAADAGIECGLALLNPVTGPGSTVIDCGANTGIGPLSAYPFDFWAPLSNNTCAYVTLDEDTSVSPSIITIYSRGYNRCDNNAFPPNPLTSHPRFTERVFEVVI
jgi:hypothetical protein